MNFDNKADIEIAFSLIAGAIVENPVKNRFRIVFLPRKRKF